MNYLHFAFFMGLLGSLHCVVMCGPLVLALPAAGKSTFHVFWNRLVYQLGRIGTYGAIGLAIGFVGNMVEMKGWQQAISITTGALLLAMGIFAFMGKQVPLLVKWQQRLLVPISRKMGYWLYRPGGNLLAGALNGLLPCGMVYMAAAAALNADSVWNGGLFMIMFGTGTLPAMLGLFIVGDLTKRRVKLNFSTWLPALFLLMGLWFLLRGSNLDIPFLSPLLYPEGAMNCR